MLEDILGNSGQIQEKLAAELKNIHITQEMEGIVLEANGAGKITNVFIPVELLNVVEKERLEDLLAVNMSRLFDSITKAEQEVSNKLMQEMLPGLGKLFGS
ncbi:MAG: YbaB/EbfC family nucleoid-associated protein [Saprospiraceae bacterium]|nr:YbaB/EbfC family nucleoid-associated protein [Saprospiraceae bacterium]